MIVTLATLLIGTFVSEDLTCITAGVLASRGNIAAVPAILACAVGIYVGDLGLWVVGRALGHRAFAHPRVAAALPRLGARSFAAWFERRMPAAVLASRFAPGTRLPLYIAAGATRTSFRRFSLWSAVAVALWTPVLVVLSAAIGDSLAARLAEWLMLGRLVAPLTLLTAFMVWRTIMRLVSLRGRQHLAAAISRIWRWEFWPMWLFYAPVAVWTFLLALRYGGYRSISAANPGIPDGGIVGESKFDILAKLPNAWTIPSAVLQPGEGRLADVRASMRERGWTYPIILKPDVGERGSGVRLASNEGDVVRYLARMTGRLVVQRYHPGPCEAGVFYFRMPGESRGHILSITDKHFAAVVGDGRSSLEDLIWANRRYRMQARTFLARMGDRRHEVPVAGQRVPLGIAGNHAQGTMFKDGRALMTPALEARIDEIARACEGFFIGRFDIRYADVEAFKAGRDLAIVELNGATAECTNVYDPDNSLLAAYRQLFRQWRLVFQIGYVNRQLGRPASSNRRLVHLLRAHAISSTPFPVSD